MTPLLAGKDASAGAARAGEYARHRPEQTLLYQLVEQYYPAFVEHLAARERALPVHVQREFKDYLKCGRLERGLIPGILPSTPSGPAFGCSNTFLTYLSARSLRGLSRRAPRGVQLQATRLLLRASCPAPCGPACGCSKSLGAILCASCGARRMAEGAALWVDEVLPREPLRQWVLSVPFALRSLFATHSAVMGQVLGIVTRAIASHLIKAAGYQHETAQTGAVTLIQRFGSALKIHFHVLFLDGV